MTRMPVEAVAAVAEAGAGADIRVAEAVAAEATRAEQAAAPEVTREAEPLPAEVFHPAAGVLHPEVHIPPSVVHRNRGTARAGRNDRLAIHRIRSRPLEIGVRGRVSSRDLATGAKAGIVQAAESRGG